MADLKISQLTGATTPLAGTEVLPIVQSSTTKKVAISDVTAGRDVAANSLKTGAGALSAWGTSAKPVEVGAYSLALAEQASGSGLLTWNLYQDGAGNFVYKTNNVGLLAQLNSTGSFNFYTAPSGTAGASASLTQVAGISTNITFNTGNLVQGTAAKGVNFTANTPAAGMTSQLLNWYEEGTWTPTISFGGGSTGITYDAQSGWYTRIGNLVTVQCIVFLSNKGSSTGNVLISGLPFATTGNNYKRNGGYGFFDRVTPCQILTDSSATTFTLQTLSTGTGSSAATLTNTDFANNSYMSITFSYFA